MFGGYPPTAIGYPPTAIGYTPTAINYPPTAIGYTPTAIGYPPTAIGYPPTAIGYPPTAIGYTPTAIGYPPAAIIGRIGHSEFFFYFYYGNPCSQVEVRVTALVRPARLCGSVWDSGWKARGLARCVPWGSRPGPTHPFSLGLLSRTPEAPQGTTGSPRHGSLPTLSGPYVLG